MLEIRVLSVSLTFVCLLPSTDAVAAPVRPNIVLMMADDMGLGDTSAYQDFTGNADEDQIHTPAMERLARIGVRFTDAHTPASRCSPTRYALLTGRYAWRSRLKHWVLFGAQGDPLIEPGRPTIASILRDRDYRTCMVGKWHVGLRYRRADGQPADGWKDADLRKPLFDSPIDHGFDVARFTSRSHGTSGPDSGARAPGGKKRGKRNGPMQSVGPGHLHGRVAIAATENGKQLRDRGPDAYVLRKLGSRHSDHAIAFLEAHLEAPETRTRPFFVYYPSNSNHGPYTPDERIGDAAVAGAARTVAGQPMNARGDFVYENDVALGRLLDYLATNDDPRSPGRKLIDNTVVIFTSDNGAERDSNVATGPFRSHKGSCYEGGHRVPFLVAWPAGGVGDGDAKTAGRTSRALIGLHDLFATFAELAGGDQPDWRKGEIGGEDSLSVLPAWRGKSLPPRGMFYHDHKQATDPAVAVLRLDDPFVDGRVVKGQWKLFFDAGLLRRGTATAVELYDLATDPREERNRVDDEPLAPLVAHLVNVGRAERTAGGHRLAGGESTRVVFDWRTGTSAASEAGGRQRQDLAPRFNGAGISETSIAQALPGGDSVTMTIAAAGQGRFDDVHFTVESDGLGISGGVAGACDGGEAILIRFDRDVILESAGLVAGSAGTCGGSCRVGDRAPLAIYCLDADIDAKDQSGLLSDLGVLPAGSTLRLDSSPHHGVEASGRWRLANLSIRVLPSTSRVR